jgi:hypothetical protein
MTDNVLQFSSFSKARRASVSSSGAVRAIAALTRPYDGAPDAALPASLK